MKVMKIGNYTNQYSTDKAKQPNNPNFGIANARTFREPVMSRLGGFLRQACSVFDNVIAGTVERMPDAARRIIGFEKSEDVAAIQVHFDASTRHLSDEVRQALKLVVERGDKSVKGKKVICASVAGNHTQNYGFGQVVSTGDDVEAAKQAITLAVNDCKMGTYLDRAYGSQRRSALAQTARRQDAVAKFTPGS